METQQVHGNYYKMKLKNYNKLEKELKEEIEKLTEEEGKKLLLNVADYILLKYKGKEKYGR